MRCHKIALGVVQGQAQQPAHPLQVGVALRGAPVNEGSLSRGFSYWHSGLLPFITVLPMMGLLGSHVATTRWLPRLADWPWEPRFNEGSLSRGSPSGNRTGGCPKPLDQSVLPWAIATLCRIADGRGGL